MLKNLRTELENKTESYLEDIEIFKNEKKQLEERINELPYSDKKTDASEDEVRKLKLFYLI